MKENLFLLKDLLELSEIKSTNIWLQYQKMCILDDIVNKYNNTNHRTIERKPVHVKDYIYYIYIYIGVDKQINNKNPKIKVYDRVSISKNKNVSSKRYIPNWSEEVFVIKKFKNTVPWTCVINNVIECY